MIDRTNVILGTVPVTLLVDAANRLTDSIFITNRNSEAVELSIEESDDGSVFSAVLLTSLVAAGQANISIGANGCVPILCKPTKKFVRISLADYDVNVSGVSLDIYSHRDSLS
jgi:hypothetical protein